MDSYKKIIISLIVLILMALLGTAGYMVIEKWNFIDSLYMTIITITTVGFGEVAPLSSMGRLHTLLVIIVGVSLGVYLISVIMEIVVSVKIQNIIGRRKLEKKIKNISKHYIVCGYGRIGKVLAESIKEKGNKLVVIDKNEKYAEEIAKDGFLYVIGDATKEETLRKAEIKKASHLIASLNQDAHNVYLILTAKTLNPDIFIMARASSIEAKSKLRAAGATRVESPYDIGAYGMALRILRPLVHKFLDSSMSHKQDDESAIMEEIILSETSKYAGKKIHEIDLKSKYNGIIITIKGAQGGASFFPKVDTVLNPEDTLVIVAPKKNLEDIKRKIYP